MGLRVDQFLESLSEAMERAAEASGARRRGVYVDEHVTFTEWVEQLGESGLKVDGHPFRLDNRPAFRFLYDLIPTTPEEARGKMLVFMKGAQIGATVWEMLADIYMGLKFMPLKIGMYVPDRSLAAYKSSERFMPIIRTVPVAYELLLSQDHRRRRTITSEGNVLTRVMGDTRFLFLWTSGKVATESYPLDVLSFDEVQEMTIAQMEKTMERLSASFFKYIFMLSTAKWPGADIDYWYRRGTQHRFHSECKCADGVVLDEVFPNCWRDHQGEVRYYCPECDSVVEEPQVGEWRASDPEAPHTSVHMCQFLSPTVTAEETRRKYWNAKDLQNFYNRVLGKPYADPSQIPVTMEILRRQADLGAQLGVVWEKSGAGEGYYMGIDNMGGFSCAIVIRRRPDGYMAVVHVEAVYGLDPWARLSELMRDFRVQVCVCEQLPNYDSAKQFAQRHLGRVFLVSSYPTIEDDMVHWGDATVSKADRKTAFEYRDRYTCSLDQYKMMSWALARITEGKCVFPDPKGLEQEIEEREQRRRIPVLQDMVWLHFTKTALVTEDINEEEHKKRRKVVRVGLDPHFSFAFMMACAAWVRAHGTAHFILPEVETLSKGQKDIQAQMPGLPGHIAGMVREDYENKCGGCISYDTETGNCAERDLIVRAGDPGCELWLDKDEGY